MLTLEGMINYYIQNTILIKASVNYTLKIFLMSTKINIDVLNRLVNDIASYVCYTTYIGVDGK